MFDFTMDSCNYDFKFEGIVEGMSRNKETKEYWFHINFGNQTVTVPVTEDHYNDYSLKERVKVTLKNQGAGNFQIKVR
jgi:hypothetical protein